MKVKEFIEYIEDCKKGFDDGQHGINPYECEMNLCHHNLSKDSREHEMAGSLQLESFNQTYVNFQTKEYLKKENRNLKIRDKKHDKRISQ